MCIERILDYVTMHQKCRTTVCNYVTFNQISKERRKMPVISIRNLTHTGLVTHMSCLTQWGRVTQICFSKLTIIGSDNDLSSGRCQAIIWTNAGILLIGPLGTNFREILIKIYKFSFQKMHLNISSGKWRPFCLSLNVLTQWTRPGHHCFR